MYPQAIATAPSPPYVATISDPVPIMPPPWPKSFGPIAIP